MKYSLLILSISFLTKKILLSQVIFVAPGGLFQEQNGAITQLSTGIAEHNFPAISRDSRFVVFSSPDPVIPTLQLIPSSDIFAFDRTAGVTRRLVDHNTAVPSPPNFIQTTFRPISAALSPNNQLLAYGVELTTRQGNANPQSGRALNVVNAANPAIFSEVRGPQAEPAQLEFTGLSWDPSGNSFVTASTGYGTLPEIVRFGFDNNSGQWLPFGRLSLSSNNGISGTFQIYPAISPSGAGLAYFEIDLIFAGGPATPRLYVANADGSNRSLVAFFNPETFPGGLAWSRDGTQLVYSIGGQAAIPGVGFTAAIDASTAVARQISTSGTTNPTQIPGIGDTPAIFVSVPTVPLLPLGFPDAANAALKASLANDIKKLKKKFKKAKKRGKSGQAKKLKKKLKKLKRRFKSL